MTEKKEFFVSYNKADKQWAKWIAATLEAAGYSCIVQAWDFRPGGNFVLDMHNALESTKRFIPVLSKSYLESLYCQAEWATAFTKDPNSEKRLFIPVRVSNVEVKGLLSAIIYIDLFSVPEEEAEKRLLHGVDIQNVPRNRPGYPGTPKERFPGTMPPNNLPFIRNVNYTGREHTLIQMADEFEHKNTVALTQIIAGLGGLGKTQTALEYAYRYASRYQYIWWVPAETEVSIIASYREFAQRTGFPDTQQSNDVILETVLNWMNANDGWLFIYDNVEECTDSSAWLPRNNHGNILITTRNRQLQIGKNVDISTFTEDEAADFLEKRTERPHPRADAKTLAERLGHLPLALEQAAAYLKINDVTIKDYLELLEKYGLQVLEEVDGVTGYPNPVTATWEVSFRKIQNEASRQLLYLCSYIAAENIDINLFCEHTDLLPTPLKEALGSALKRNKTLRELTKYALLEKQEDRQGYSMHRLLQEVVREKLTNAPQYAQCCLNLFDEAYRFKYSSIPSFMQLTPHVEAFLQAINTLPVLQDDDTQEVIAILYNRGSRGFDALGNYPKALEWNYKALSILEKILGTEHPSTATIYDNIGLVYGNQGDYEKALEWHYKALAIKEKVLGTEHPSTAATYNNIAIVYYNQSDYAMALKWYKKALAIREKVLGTEHPDAAATYDNTGVVYHKQGDYAKAFKWYKKALAIKEKVLGTEHPQTANTYNNIAGVYYQQDDYAMALEWLQKALAIYEKKLGTEHPDTANSYGNIGLMYDSQGDYGNALEWYQKALTVYENKLGDEHPDTKGVRENIEILKEQLPTT